MYLCFLMLIHYRVKMECVGCDVVELVADMELLGEYRGLSEYVQLLKSIT